MNRHIIIESLTPLIDAGLYPVKVIAGDLCTVEADIFRDREENLKARLVCYTQATQVACVPLTLLHNDRWRGSFTLPQPGRYFAVIEAWTDLFGSWLTAFSKKIAAKVVLVADILEGRARLLAVEQHLQQLLGAHGESVAHLGELTEDLEILQTFSGNLQVAAERQDFAEALKLTTDLQLRELVARHAPPQDLVRSMPIEYVVEREAARFAAWYQLFIRSQGSELTRPATFKEAALRLPLYKSWGFDTLCLAPIQPIGRTNRKGPNDALCASPEDPGCPWAVGNEAGGHMAVDPALGTLADFQDFVLKAAAEGLEVALELSLQCSPDHPWVQEHPSWFCRYPDGTFKLAQYTPLRYGDIYALDFDTPHREALWQALYEVVIFWINQGIKNFRIDDARAKPLEFWRWLINKVKSNYPEVLFSTMMQVPDEKFVKNLAKLGFSSVHTCFVRSHLKKDILTSLQTLLYSESQYYYLPNFFTNTPDVLPAILQKGGLNAFKVRLILAATLAPAYGIYSGFELAENLGDIEQEVYLNSEKYELKVRHYPLESELLTLITFINQLRREHPSLRLLHNLQFLQSDHEQIIAYGKRSQEDILLFVVNLDPFNVHNSIVRVPSQFIGIEPEGRYEVRDLLTNMLYNWGESNYVRLDPQLNPVHILQVERLL